jgi:hypothetical protein
VFSPTGVGNPGASQETPAPSKADGCGVPATDKCLYSNDCGRRQWDHLPAPSTGTAVAVSTCSSPGASGSVCWGSGSGESSMITSDFPAGSSASGCPGDSWGAGGANPSSGVTAAVDLLKTKAQHFYCDFYTWLKARSKALLTSGIGSLSASSTPASTASLSRYSWREELAYRTGGLAALARRCP